MQTLQERKRAYLVKNTDYPQEYPDTMPPWDYAYYTRLLLEDLQVEHTKISEYFPLQSTVSAMLEIFARILQLRFVPVPPEAIIGSQWHEDVEAWSVWDERVVSKGNFVGYLYADLLWRPNKHQGSQNVNLQCVRAIPHLKDLEDKKLTSCP
jgi:metallopeptidase MepB